jgi:hypothetical protein
MLLFHYTDLDGYNAINASPTWVFRAIQPPGGHEFGAYFTTYSPDRPLYKLGTPIEKRGYLFCFTDIGDLNPIRGGRGSYILFSAMDYPVIPDRQVWSGPASDFRLVMP